MYQKILVPLDGSELAECVLPHVEAITKGCRVKNVVVVRVLEPVQLPSGADFAFTPEQMQQMDSQHRAEVEKYLSQVVSRLSSNGVNVQSEVITGGMVAERIADYATKNEVDLIIIATHGRSGVSRWIWGSVTDRIVHSACVPVLMVRAPGCVPGI
jgi:nucleotide-binding universal stress UspA family protein